MKWFLIKSQENQLCSQQMLTKVHKFICNQITIQYVILPLQTHDEDHFHYPQQLKLDSGTHTEWILNRYKKQIKSTKK